MATNFPTSLDSLVNPTATDEVSVVDHAAQHTNANDAIEALEAKVGVDGSAVTSSLDYLVKVSLPASIDGKVDENAAITGATKTKITYDAKGLVTAGADATTADIAASTNRNYVTDAQLTVIGNTSGTNTGDQINISGNAATVTTNANLTGDVTSVGNATSIAAGVIVDNDINASAAIKLTKLAAVTASRALVSDASGFVHPATTTSTEIGYVNGVTSAIQTQLNAKQGLDATLTALAAYNTNGILTQTAADTFTGRTITGTANKITVTNGDGVSGNPTLTIPDAVTLVTPALGTPSGGTLTNCTGLPIVAGTTGTLTAARGGTGLTSLGIGIATFLGATYVEPTSYTPTIGGTGASLGNGTATGFYTRIANTVTVFGSVTYGSTTNFGSGILTITVPVNAASGAYLVGMSAQVLDIGSKYWSVTTDSGGLNTLIFYNESGAFVNNTSPMTWAAGDIIRFNITYQV